MDFIETIKRPWVEPISYLDLAFWVIIFGIVAHIIYDMLRILIAWGAQAVTA